MESTPKDPKKLFDLPYFDRFVEILERGGNETLETIVGANVHWGYWADPKAATLTNEDFLAASDALTRKLLAWAKPTAGQKILDVGCGFGGTIGLLNTSYTDLNLVGLNIDERQLTRARKCVQPRATHNNTIEFIAGDACALPFLDESFDTVLAVECIFHFPSRRRFFEQAHRVLRPGGKLVLCDFIARPLLFPVLGALFLAFRKDITGVYGHRNTLGTLLHYRWLAGRTGFNVQGIEDITAHTMPTYQMIRKCAPQSGFEPESFIRAHAVSEYGSKLGALRYDIVAFEKMPAGA